MIENIIIIVANIFSLRDYQRFGIEILEQNGFKIEVWDISTILYPGLSRSNLVQEVHKFSGLKLFKDKAETYSKLTSLSRNTFIINFVNYSFDNLWLYQAISRSYSDYAVSCVNAIPIPVVKKNIIGMFVEAFKKILSYRYLKTWKRLFIKLPPIFFRVKPARFMLAGGNMCFNYHYPVGRHTEILQIHAFDYDLYLREKSELSFDKPIAVFLDEFFPLHPDYILLGRDCPISSDVYYQLLNNFFDLVEKETGLEVIIAEHPRSKYENFPDLFKGRKRVKGKTISLVKESRLVLSHSSTSLNFANLFYKPVIFIICSDLKDTWEYLQIMETAKWFGKKPVFIDTCSNFNLEAELEVNREAYDNYRRAYIKTEQSEDIPFWQIVANRIKKGG